MRREDTQQYASSIEKAYNNDWQYENRTGKTIKEVAEQLASERKK